MRVSVIIPTYNRPKFLDRLLASIQKQTYQAFEVIVVDDHSHCYEDYITIFNKYKYCFKELKFLRNETNRGAPYSRNRGIKEAIYNLIAFVDDDDEWFPEKLQKQVELFVKSDKEVGLIYTWVVAHDINGLQVEKYESEFEGFLPKEILKECFIPSPSVMLRKDAITKVGGFDESLVSCQDWDMWTRIIFSGYKIKCVKNVLAIYNKHQDGNIGSHKNAIRGYRKYILKHAIKYIRHLMIKLLIKRIYFYFVKTRLL